MEVIFRRRKKTNSSHKLFVERENRVDEKQPRKSLERRNLAPISPLLLLLLLLLLLVALVIYLILETNRNGSPAKDEKPSQSGKNVSYRPVANEETHYNKSIRTLTAAEIGRWLAGERGIGVEIEPESLTDEDLAARERMLNTHAFDEFISEIISVERTLPDFRPQWCKDTYPSSPSSLPRTSIIICFHNEALSTLLRSIYSIVNRSPPHLIVDILLIDDASDLRYLGEPLERHIRGEVKFGKVRLIRLNERHGLIRCRLRGVKEASEVAESTALTFLDSHIEAGHGWLEPLLTSLRDRPNVIVCPVIDAINDTTFHYHFVADDLYGLFNWRLDFEWHNLSDEERRAKADPWAPHRTPVMAGGLFAVTKPRFADLGFYDDQMRIWGGENLELSLKAWMCSTGNKETIMTSDEYFNDEYGIDIMPCSRVGHIFRSWSPYNIQEEEINHNNIRVAQVWLDEFKYLYFDRIGRFGRSTEDRLGHFGDVSKLQEWRRQKKCRSFRWFLNAIAVSLPYHRIIGAGEIRNSASGLCLDKKDRTDKVGEPIDLIPCHDQGGNQYFILNDRHRLIRDYNCLGVLRTSNDEVDLLVGLVNCGEDASEWKYDVEAGTISIRGTNLCMTVNENSVSVEVCRENDQGQHFRLTKYDAAGFTFEELFHGKS